MVQPDQPKSTVKVKDEYGSVAQDRFGRYYRPVRGEIEIIVKDAKTGEVLKRQVEHNIIKIFAKEILSHRVAYSKVWDPNASSGAGAWVASGIDPDEELALKYFLLGASFDATGSSLDTADTRFYTFDTVTQTYSPIRLGTGAEYEGSLINAIPISEPNRALKKVERVFFEPTYQPAGTPLLQADVRAINNIVVFETTLRKDEYNGFGGSISNDFFTITEIAIAAGRELSDNLGACECTPRDIFLQGDNGVALDATASGTSTVTLNVDPSLIDLIKEGDQIKIVDASDSAGASNSLDQVTPFYLVLTKAVGSPVLTLDRTPQLSDGTPISGAIGVFRDGLKIFGHRILSVPIKKSSDIEIVLRYSLLYN